MSAFNSELYHSVLCSHFPDFLKKYLTLPILTRLKGIGLLCGTDWTPLYYNHFFYSRFEHSVGCALIAWNFTKDKKQAIASLLHDVSTTIFSHVSDFRKGDALTQSVTENENKSIILNSVELAELLKQDGLTLLDVCDYHKYPICDNDIPGLSSDRLEYMYPSGMSLADEVIKNQPLWNFDLVKQSYNDIVILKNEFGVEELGFNSAEIAQDYCKRCCDVGLILQRNENKLALNMLGRIVNLAIKEKLISEESCYSSSEEQIIKIFDEYAKCNTTELASLIKTFRTMKKITHSDTLPENTDEFYVVNLNVKKRYINPLVKNTNGNAVRISEVSNIARECINDFLAFNDTVYGFVKLVK